MNLKSAPACIGIIMDGNRRWAKGKGLPPFEGHRRGYEKLKEALHWTKEGGIKYLIVYALSTENWNRAKEEVSYLLGLIRLVLTADGRKLFKPPIKRFRPESPSMKKVSLACYGQKTSPTRT